MAQYDLVVIGGGPVGLSAAYQAAVKRRQRVAVIEQFTFQNQYGSSSGFGRQWRTCYNELYLTKLAVETSSLWDQLMEELDDNTILDRTGVLWFGDATVTTPEGNITEAAKNLALLEQEHTLYHYKQDIAADFPFIAGALDDFNEAKALFSPNGGTINVVRLISLFLKYLKASNCHLFQNQRVKEIDYQKVDKVTVLTHEGYCLTCNKIILAAGPYINLLLSTLKPEFPHEINLKPIQMLTSCYFRVKDPSKLTKTDKWPVWISFAPENQKTYYGFPTSPFDRDWAGFARVAPLFSCFEYELYSPPLNERKVDNESVKSTSSFVSRSMTDLDGSQAYNLSTCLISFASSGELNDEREGFVLDFLPGSNKQIVIATGGWAMKFVPVFGIILADLALDGSTKYGQYIKPMAITDAILKSKP